MTDPKEMWRRFVYLRNAKDINGLVALYADDGVLEFPGRGQIKGREAIVSFYQGNFTAHPDATMTLVTQAVSGQTIITEWNETGTNTGPLAKADGTSIPATGKPFTVNGVAVLEVEDELIRSNRVYFNLMSVLAQLGLMPAPAGAKSG